MGSYVHQRDILLGKTNILKKNYIRKIHEKVTNNKHVTGLNFERQKTIDDFRHVESSFKRKYKKYLNGEGTKNVHKLEVQSDDEDHIQTSLPPLRGPRRRKNVRHVDTEINSKNTTGETVNWNDIVKSKRSKSDLTKELSYLQSTLSSFPTSAETSFSSGSPRQVSPERQLVSVRMPANMKKAKQSPRLDTPAVAKRDEYINETSLVNPLTVLPNIASKSADPEEDGSPKPLETSRHVQFLEIDEETLSMRPRARRNTLETGMLSKHRRKKLPRNTQIPAIAEEPLDTGMPRLQRSKSFGDIYKLKESQSLTKAALRVMADHSQGAKKFKYVGKLTELGMKDFKSTESESTDNDIDYSELHGCRYLRIPSEIIDNDEASQADQEEVKKSVKFWDHEKSTSP